MRRFLARTFLALALALAGLVAPAQAQEWSNDAELTVLFSGGNAESSSFGLRNTLRREGDAGELRVIVSGMRTESVEVQRVAEGDDPADFVVREERDRDLTAERYGVEGRYNWDLSEQFFAFGALGWDRNVFSGFEHRTIASAGAGNTFGPGEEEWRLRLGYGLTYTERRDVTPDPTRASGFVGLRATVDHQHRINDRVSAELQWRFDATPQQWDDVRAELVQSLSSELTEYLSLKTTLELFWDNDPSLESVPLLLPDGSPTGENVLIPLGSLDHTVSFALVVGI